jgi:hypothetical protein
MRYTWLIVKAEEQQEADRVFRVIESLSVWPAVKIGAVLGASWCVPGLAWRLAVGRNQGVQDFWLALGMYLAIGALAPAAMAFAARKKKLDPRVGGALYVLSPAVMPLVLADGPTTTLLPLLAWASTTFSAAPSTRGSGCASRGLADSPGDRRSPAFLSSARRARLT